MAGGGCRGKRTALNTDDAGIREKPCQQHASAGEAQASALPLTGSGPALRVVMSDKHAFVAA